MTSTPFVSSRRARSSLSASLLGTTLLLAASVRAQDMTEAGAQLLDAEGTALLNQHQLAAACPKLEQSYRLKPGTGVLLRLALCQERSGKGALALAFYLEAAERAKVAGNSRIAQLAQNRAAALEPRLSRLTVDFGPSVKELPKLRVSLDGTPLELTTLAGELPLDPGSHVLEAVAPERKRFEHTLVVSDEPRRYTITIVLPQNELEVETKGVSQPQLEATHMPGASWSAQQSWALVAGGVGIAGLTAGTFLGLAVGSRMQRARDLCAEGTSGCPEEALALQDQAGGYALASTIAFAAGAAGIAGGIALWLTAPHRRERPLDAQVRVVPMVSLDAAGIQAVGRW